MICDLQTSLDNIATAIESLNTTAVNNIDICCDYADNNPPAIPSPESDFDTESDPIPPHLPPDIDDALCLLLNYAYGGFLSLMDSVARLAQTSPVLGLMLALVGVFFPEPVSTFVGGATFMTIVILLLDIGDVANAIYDILDDADEWIRENYNDVFCAVKTGQSRADKMVLLLWEQIAAHAREYAIANGHSTKIIDIINALFVNSLLARLFVEDWILDNMNDEWLAPPDERLDCTCVPVLPDCGIAPDYTWSWVWDDPMLFPVPNGENGANYQRTERVPFYVEDENALAMKQGGGGYKATRIGMSDVPVMFELVCVQVLATSTHGHGLKVAQQASDAVGGDVTLIDEGGYKWYALSPNAVTVGEDIWLNSSIPTTTTSINIKLREVRFLFRSV